MLWRKLLIALALLPVLGVILVAATPQRRIGFKTVLFIPQVLPSIPIRPQEWFTDDPIRQEVSYPIPSGQGVADLYTPADEGEHAAVLLFLGVNPAGRDDDRVVNLANALARSGMVVLIPWSDTMTQKRIETAEIENLVSAYQYLVDLDMVDPERAGMGGFCVGASLAMVAAQDHRIRDQVSFINSFGGYYDIADLLRSISSESRAYDGAVEPWDPKSLTREVFTAHLIEGVEDNGERELLTRHFIDGAQIAEESIAALSPGASAAYRLLKGTSYEEAGALLGELSPKTLEFIRRVSPSTNINQLKAQVLIMHDREDRLVPAEESRRLEDRIAENGNVYRTEFSFFQHVDPTRSVSPPVFAREAIKLFLHMYHIVKETA